MKPWFEGPTPRVLAHRGLATEAPENTLLAFVRALALGVTHLETDVHATRDGVAVLSHDPDLGRLTGMPTEVRSVSLRDLQAIRLADDQQVPTLAEALDAFPETFFNIDIKSDDALQPTITAIRDQKAVRRVLVTSFDDKRRKAAVEALPGVATSPSSIGVVAAAVASRVPRGVPGRKALQARALRGVDALQIPERRGHFLVLTPALVEMAHRHGVEVQVWTVNEPDDMRRLVAMGVDGVFTDRADLAVEALRDPAR